MCPTLIDESFGLNSGDGYNDFPISQTICIHVYSSLSPKSAEAELQRNATNADEHHNIYPDTGTAQDDTRESWRIESHCHHVPV